ELTDDLAPGIADQAVAIGSAPATILPPLPRRHHPDLVFNGAGAYQGVPVSITRLPGKGAGQANPFGALFSQGSEQLRKAKVITDRQPKLPYRSIHRNRRIAGLKRSRRPVLAVGGFDTGMEQVNLVVAGHVLTTIVVPQSGGAHPVCYR